MRKDKTKGFSIVEALVAMAIFVTVITLAVGGFVTSVRLQRKALIMRTTQQNARNAIEIISKDARQAKSISICAEPPAGTCLRNPTLYLNISEGGTFRILYYVAFCSGTTDCLVRRVDTFNNGVNLDAGYTPGTPTPLTALNTKASDLAISLNGNLLTVSFKISNIDTATNTYDQDEVLMETTIILEGTKQ